MNKIDALEQGSLQTKVFKTIEDAILSGELEPGHALTEQKLSTELGVSRTPVREALSRLESEGLVTGVPNKSFVVVGVSEKDIDDIYTIRMKIESLAARWAAQNVTEDELSELREVLELQEFFASKSDFMQIRHLDSRFHEIIYSASRSRPLKSILSQFHKSIQKPREISVKYAGRAIASVEEHRRIYDAIAAHNGDEAENAAAEHIKNAKENLLRVLAQ